MNSHSRSPIMSNRFVWFVAASACLPTVPLAAKMPSVFDGYVTNIVSSSEFDVGDRHILCNAQTKWRHDSHLPESLTKLRVGMLIHVKGEFRNAGFTATDVELDPGKKNATAETMDGRGLIQQTPTLHQDAQGWTGVLWVDGYPLQVTSRTKLLAADGTDLPAPSLATNTWVSYQADRDKDGAITASKMTFEPIHVDAGEQAFRIKREPNYTAPDPANHTPGELRVGSHPGLTLTLLDNQDVQDYVSKIGNSLIPPYQMDLTAGDSTKIDFRFYVIRHRSWLKGTLLRMDDLPNGIVLVPDTALNALQNEAQLAALLSSCIADILEKQAYLHRSRLITPGDINLANDLAGSIFLPFGIAQGTRLEKLIFAMNERADRIGLTYMLKQGYDIREAPFAPERGLNEEVHNPLKPREWPVGRTASLMEDLRLDYAATDYSALKTNREAYEAIQAKLRAAYTDLPKPRNHSD